jgi:hypothetical protein
LWKTQFNRNNNKFIYKQQKPRWLQAEVELYVFAGWHSNSWATSFAVSSTSARTTSAVSVMGPCTTGSREVLGSRL